MNDTPETDAILKQFEHLLPNWLASEMAAVARKLERERDEAVNACHIWQGVHSKLLDTIAALQEIIQIIRKQNNECLTILQEHGLAEYGN
jgi:hypothetical protein